MRVYYSSSEYIDFPTATHWEQCGGDWVELLTDKDEIVCILNWKHVWLMKPL